MCGIIYLQDKNRPDVHKSVLKRYYKQKSRGSDGFGFVAFNLHNGKISKIGRAENESEISELMTQNPDNAFLFHHRYPTSTPNLKEVTHPILVKNKRLKFDYYVAHNGIIDNDSKMKEKHEKLGYKYRTEIRKSTLLEIGKKKYAESETMFNDSESLAIEVAEFIEGKQTIIEATGSIAFIALQIKNGIVQKVYYARNYRSPLNIENSGSLFSIKSENGKEIKGYSLFSFNPLTPEKTIEQKIDFGSYTNYADYTGYTGYIGNANNWEVEYNYKNKTDSSNSSFIYFVNANELFEPLWYYDIETLLEMGNTIESLKYEIQNQIKEIDSIVKKHQTFWLEAEEYKDELKDMLKELENMKYLELYDEYQNKMGF